MGKDFYSELEERISNVLEKLGFVREENDFYKPFKGISFFVNIGKNNCLVWIRDTDEEGKTSRSVSLISHDILLGYTDEEIEKCLKRHLTEIMRNFFVRTFLNDKNSNEVELHDDNVKVTHLS